MQTLFGAIIVGLVIVIILMLYRVFHGPTFYDRLNGLFVIGADVILLILMYGVYIGQMEFVIDISFTFAILGFVTWVIIAKYICPIKTTDDSVTCPFRIDTCPYDTHSDICPYRADTCPFKEEEQKGEPGV